MTLPANFLDSIVESVEDMGVMTERARICHLILEHATTYAGYQTDMGDAAYDALRLLFDQITNPVPDTPQDAA